MKPSVAIVGCGKVGTSLGMWIAKNGYAIAGVASKSLSSAERAAKLIQTDRFTQTASEVTRDADIVFLTTPDGVITDACGHIAKDSGFKENAVVLHCSGAQPSTLLRPAKSCGARIGSMWPMQSFASAKTDVNPFEGIIVALEGEDDAVDTARQIASALGATSYTIRTDAKMLYHASAVVASNYLVTLLGLAFKLTGAAGIAATDAYEVLKPLVNGTLSNIERVGIPDALTGPISRGDVKTVEQHLDAIGSKTPELLSLYRTLGLHTIGIARDAGTLSEETAAELGEMLGSGA